jgi:hypothetical protein
VSVLNRRNAIAGWAVWKFAKRALRKKLKRKQPTPPPVVQKVRSPKALVALLVAAGAGVATFLRLRKGGDEQ